MQPKIVLAGGTGFLGKYLFEKYASLGYDILVISRGKNYVDWNDKKAIIEALDGAEMLVNLAGKSVNCRYTEVNKKEILDSRVETTKILGEAVLQCKTPPKIWMNASTATIYRHSEDKPMTEESAEYGKEYSCFVGKTWEETFFSFSLPQTRQVALRISIVLGKDGALPEYEKIVRWGLGGKQGNGNQMMSWIHIDDFYRAVSFIQNHSSIEGKVNITSPNPVPNHFFMETLRKSMNKKFGLATPKWMLKIGASLMGTEIELLLKSRWVVPQKLLANGFEFEFPTIEKALKNLEQPAE
ncbi:TIGR01777 family protein [Arachidicoccus ginsenosidimutans]|uniref:TIGR01777 family oxidoreductase n=1 Tax=Arachidicoccus sp. BS20 TaxID=1850526 RepID=UPI0007F0C5E4|nr:TIGR01777 family oxidoreductase [Arachidicoccus sp. BS20]ANI90583.1 TIGR01777 family protein [Arachidicoccus sp. BS20]